MQLKLQRSQRMGGIMGATVIFCLDVQTDYSAQEADNVSKYRLGKQVIYNSRAATKHLDAAKARSDRGTVAGYVTGAVSLARAVLSLNISIDSLARGQHIECKDLEELLEAEEAVMEACRILKRYLDTAATFNGSLALIDFDDGEKLHVGQGSLALISGPPSVLSDALQRVEPEPDEYETWQDWFDNLNGERVLKFAAVAIPVALIVWVFVMAIARG